MDALNIGGINFGLIGGIIGVLFAMKRIDTKEILGKKFYIVAVLVFGFLAGAFLVAEKFQLKCMITEGLIHAGIASILYQTGKLVIPSEEGFFNNKKEKIHVAKNKAVQ